MTEWIDFAVYIVFLVAVCFVQPTTHHRLALPMLADRNPEWVASHPEIVRRINEQRWRLWLSYAVGVSGLFVLTCIQLGLWHSPVSGHKAVPKWMMLWNFTMAPVLVWLAIELAIGIPGRRALKKMVPVAPRRQATLEPRSLDTWIPRWVQRATYAFVLANLAAWIGAGLLGLHTSPVFWTRVVTFFFLSSFFYLATKLMIARRAHVMDRIFGPSYRPWEVRFTFAMQILPPIIGALRLFEEVTANQLLDVTRALQLALSAMIAAILLRLSRLPVDRDGTPPARNGSALARG